MTDLHCNATKCANNQSEFCCRPDIMVGGPNSCSAKQTYCANFLDENDIAPRDSVDSQSPNQALDIHCDVANCVYNQDRACNAEHVDISTTQVNGGQVKTACSTYKSKTM